ncbi:MAG: hypothetical protein DRN19_04315 [Thermoplasmata archaeon]|nr:MAG: hypothetical protein DRN19_04315 [Thermoplasmata archaeon]
MSSFAVQEIEGAFKKDMCVKQSFLFYPRTWVRTVGYGENVFYCVEQTKDGGYIAIGRTFSHRRGAYLVWLVKTDKNGKMLWDKKFGGGNPIGGSYKWNFGYSVQQTADGGYIIAGLTEYYGHGKFDLWLIKTDGNGNEEWNKTFGGKYTWEEGYCVQQTTDGGYIVVGCKYHRHDDADLWLVKTDSNGNEEWNKTFGGEGDDIGYCIQQTRYGGFIIVGSTESYGHGNRDIWLIRIDDNGREKWNRTFGGWRDEGGHWVQQTKDGGFVILGRKEGSDSIGTLIIKTDNLGNVVWSKTFEKEGWEIVGKAIHQSIDGGYIIGGYTVKHLYLGGRVLLIKIDRKGNEEWNQTFKVKDYSRCYWVRQTKDGGYILAGFAANVYSWPIDGGFSIDYYGLLIKTNRKGKVFAWRLKLFWNDLISVFT